MSDDIEAVAREIAQEIDFTADRPEAKEAIAAVLQRPDIQAKLRRDDYHTMDELYEHRHRLFIALMRATGAGWISKEHHEPGTMFDGWFIAGIETEQGHATYHLPIRLWDDAMASGATVLGRGHEWDGHTADDVLARLSSAKLRPRIKNKHARTELQLTLGTMERHAQFLVECGREEAAKRWFAGVDELRELLGKGSDDET